MSHLAPTPTTILGLRAGDMSFSDICEEIKDVRNDIAVVEDYEAGRISRSELERDTTFQTTDLTLLREGLEVLRAWRAAHIITV